MRPDSGRSARPTWWRPVLTVAVFSALPFAVFLNDNRAEAELDPGIALYALVVLVLGLLAVVAVDRLRGASARERAAVVFAAAAFVFFHFQLARSVAELTGFSAGAGAAALVVWLILFVAALVIASRLSRHPVAWNYVVVAGVLLLALPVIQYGYFKATASDTAGTGGDSAGVSAPRVQAGETSPSTALAGQRPDVYFFLLDGYGRADQLEATVGYDNSRFLRLLERRGFEVHDTATAAYPLTFLSLASTLEMDYPAPVGELGAHTPFFDAIEGDNETVGAFHELGYRFVFATDYSSFECGDQVDLCVEPREGVIDVLIGERERAILQATPLAEVLPALGIHASPLSGYLSPEDVVEEVERERSDGPVFVYSHILAPHPPYRYLEGCELKTDLRNPSLVYWGEAEGSGGEEYRQAIECINRSLLASVDTILARQRDAIIVIQGDHGPKFGIDFQRPLSEWSKAELAQRFPILNAQRLPRDCSPSGPRAGFAVNTFRFVLGCITGRAPDPLSPRHFMIDLEQGQIERTDEAVLVPGQR